MNAKERKARCSLLYALRIVGPLPPLLMMRLLPRSRYAAGYRYEPAPTGGWPLPLLIMIGKESDLRSPPLLALMLLSQQDADDGASEDASLVIAFGF